MSKLRRLLRVVRGRRLVAVGLFLVCTYLFANNLDPTPRFVVRTTEERDPVVNMFHRPYLQSVSNGGLQVILRYESSFNRGGITRVELWDVGSGRNLTPAHWRTEAWRELANQGWEGDGPGLLQLASDPTGQKFLRDEAAWGSFNRRFSEDHRKTRDDSPPIPVWGMHFSPDGLFITYALHIKSPLPEYPEVAFGTWTVVENAFSGERLAMLPSRAGLASAAPGGGTVVCRAAPIDPHVPYVRQKCESDMGERPRFVLWDLRTKSVRATLSLPTWSSRLPEYARDGRYLFASSFSPPLLRWWDVETGTQVGEITELPTPQLLNGSRILVQADDPELLHFWDLVSGRQLPDWKLPPPPTSSGKIGQVESAGDRYIAVSLDRDAIAKSPNTIPIVERIIDRLPKLPEPTERRRVLVLDPVDRCIVGTLPGRSAAFSADGRWLATINSEGVVRVWEVPFGRPWGRGLAYAAALVFGSWLLIALSGKIWRRLWRRKANIAG